MTRSVSLSAMDTETRFDFPLNEIFDFFRTFDFDLVKTFDSKTWFVY